MSPKDPDPVEGSPPPPDDGWWEAIFREETRRTMRDEPGAPGGPRNHDGWGSASDWTWARDLYEQDQPVDLPVVGFNRGGLLVQARGLRGFVPLSHVLDLCQESRALRPPELDPFIGRTLHLRVIEFDPPRGRLVLSERAAQAAPGKRAELLRCLQPGECVKGRVTNLTPFGAFVDLGGVEGLIHVSEISWGRVRHPQDVLRIGETVEARVLSLDPEQGRVALSLRALRPDPWEALDERIRVGDLVGGRATSVVKFGVFVEIEHGVEGLVHVSECPGDGASPIDGVQEGEQVRVRVIRLDPAHRRLGLSLRLDEEERIPERQSAG